MLNFKRGYGFKSNINELWVDNSNRGLLYWLGCARDTYNEFIEKISVDSDPEFELLIIKSTDICSLYNCDNLQLGLFQLLAKIINELEHTNLIAASDYDNSDSAILVYPVESPDGILSSEEEKKLDDIFQKYFSILCKTVHIPNYVVWCELTNTPSVTNDIITDYDNEDIEFARSVYKSFKMHWLYTHGITMEDIYEKINEWKSECSDDDTCDFESYLEETGFISMIWPCFDEFLETEFQDHEFIRNMLQTMNKDIRD